METTCTDTQSVRAKGIEIDYWLNIDVIDSELSGMPLNTAMMRKYQHHLA